jgi:hypothetical protein
MPDGPMQQNPDGSWSPVTPLGWQGTGVDWEVYTNRRPMEAVAYDEDVCVAVVKARTRFGLYLRMLWAKRRIDRGGAA